MLYRTTIDVAAPAAQVWSLVRDVESWPTWHPAMTTVEVQGPQLEPGVPVLVSQPGRRPDLYTVLAVDDHRFLWAARRTGFRQWADHRVESLDPEHCRVELAFGVDGMLAPVVGPLARRTVVRLVDSEAAHLKSHAESGGGSAM
jgi:carbon monoxide dehydrogenase subunit G